MFLGMGLFLLDPGIEKIIQFIKNINENLEVQFGSRRNKHKRIKYMKTAQFNHLC